MLTVTTKKIAEQSGRSMIEMLGVLSVIAILSIGGLLGYSQAVKKYRFNELVDEITQITNNIRTRFSGQSRARDLTMEQAIRLGIFPEKMVNKDKTGVTHPFKGDVTFEFTNNRYVIDFNNLPDDILLQLASSDLDLEDNLFWIAFDEYTIEYRKHEIERY